MVSNSTRSLLSLALVFVFLAGSPGFSSDEDCLPFLQDNGNTWLNYGPAIIKQCKSIVLYDNSDKHRRLILRADQTNFDEALNWLEEHFSARLNCSPKKPGGGVKLTRYVYLFAQPDPPDVERTADGVLLLGQRKLDSEVLRKSYLLGIPLYPDGLGVSESAFEKMYRAFRRHFEQKS